MSVSTTQNEAGCRPPAVHAMEPPCAGAFAGLTVALGSSTSLAAAPLRARSAGSAVLLVAVGVARPPSACALVLGVHGAA